MSARNQKRQRQRKRPERTQPEDLGGRPTTAGAAPGGAPTGLRHQTDITATGGGAAGVESGGSLPVGAGGGTGTGAGGLGTGIAGIGGARNLGHGAGRPAPAEATLAGQEFEEPGDGADTDEAGQRSGGRDDARTGATEQ